MTKLFRRSNMRESKRLEDGAYVAVIKSVRLVQGKYGEQLEVVFKVGGNGVERRGYLPAWVGERNITKRFLDALKIEKDIEEIEESDLVGKALVIVLKTVESGGRLVQRVVDYKGV